MAAAGWGGRPRTAASYVIDRVEKNDGETPHQFKVKDVPVNAFWSFTVYNADGYLEKNGMGVNSYNNFSAEVGEDGFYTIHLGACDDGRNNFISIGPGCNYAVRLYEPGPEIFDGQWHLPTPEPIK